MLIFLENKINMIQFLSFFHSFFLFFLLIVGLFNAFDKVKFVAKNNTIFKSFTYIDLLLIHIAFLTCKIYIFILSKTIHKTSPRLRFGVDLSLKIIRCILLLVIKDEKVDDIIVIIMIISFYIYISILKYNIYIF